MFISIKKANVLLLLEAVCSANMAKYGSFSFSL